MIKIVLLLLLFFLYVYVSTKKEGLKNYQPIVKNNRVYGVNVIKGHKDHIHNRLINEKDPLYQERFKTYHRSDVVLDMQYFNNATYLMQSYNPI
jgi:hypothetical protein